MTAEHPSVDALLAAAAAYPTALESAWAAWQHNLTDTARSTPTYWEAFKAAYAAASEEAARQVEVMIGDEWGIAEKIRKDASDALR